MEKEPTKHSGGEWRISDWGSEVVITASKFPLLRGSEQVCDCSNSLKPKEEVLANAKLFVEAPETKEQRDALLISLKALLSTPPDNVDHWLRATRDAERSIDLCKGE